ncbi:MAG TPA: hypothetical protein VFL47_03235 [Flavisolibacter sp.]|nr:hypothetical protein [Flavisolibacter sp.]
MKKIVTQLLYVFSFSLLFVALYLNFVQKDRPDASYLKSEKRAQHATIATAENSAVAQPETNTVLK